MPAARPLDSVFEALQRLPLDRLTLVAPVFRRGGYLMVSGDCSICERRSDYGVNNLERGLSKGCRCRRKVKYDRNELARVLGERYDAIKQRCENPKDANFHRYGGRGIQNRFESREAFIRHMLKLARSPSNNALTASDLSRWHIDRRDNEGHYEPGNVFLVSRQRNNSNTRRRRVTTYKGAEVVAAHLWQLLKNDCPEFAYSPKWTENLAKQGKTGEEILALARHRRSGGRKAKPLPPRSLETLAMYPRITGLRIRTVARP